MLRQSLLGAILHLACNTVRGLLQHIAWRKDQLHQAGSALETDCFSH